MDAAAVPVLSCACAAQPEASVGFSSAAGRRIVRVFVSVIVAPP